jgi:hypothetical protein
MRQMTAGTLQQWATQRIRVSTEAPLPKSAGPRVETELEPLKPSEDFRIDGQTKASQALAENRNAIAALQNLLDAASKIGAGSRTQLSPSTVAWLNSVGVDTAELLRADPTMVRIFNKSAMRLVLNTINRLTARPAYREFKTIESNAGARGQLRPAVIRDIASALLGKMGRENTTIVAIVRHRRSAGAGGLVADGYITRGGM